MNRDELIERAAGALIDNPTHYNSRLHAHTVAQMVLDAVTPLIEADLREQIAGEIAEGRPEAQRRADRIYRTRGEPDLAAHSYLKFDGMAWPNPCDPREVQWRLRYGTPTKSDLLVAASFMHAYAHLIELPQRERNERVTQIRKAFS